MNSCRLYMKSNGFESKNNNERYQITTLKIIKVIICNYRLLAPGQVFFNKCPQSSSPVKSPGQVFQ